MKVYSLLKGLFALSFVRLKMLSIFCLCKNNERNIMVCSIYICSIESVVLVIVRETRKCVTSNMLQEINQLKSVFNTKQTCFSVAFFFFLLRSIFIWVFRLRSAFSYDIQHAKRIFIAGFFLQPICFSSFLHIFRHFFHYQISQ